MAAKDAKTAAEADLLNSKEEVSPLTEEELAIISSAKAKLTEQQLSVCTEVDDRAICRGFREEGIDAIEEAFIRIMNFRLDVNWLELEGNRLQWDEEFHKWWEERVYGTDKDGHVVIGFRYEDIQTDEMLKKIESEDHLFRLVAQKMHHQNQYKAALSSASGVQRYKHHLVIDIKGAGMGLLAGQKSSLIKRLFKMGSENFPEIIWKIHVVNAPFMFRAMWAAVKGWVHPITQAKINMHSSLEKAVADMEALGVPKESIPVWVGGQSKGIPFFDIMLKQIEDHSKSDSPPEESANTDALAAEVEAKAKVAEL